MYLSLKIGAIFLADAHYNEKNIEFLIFLEKLKNKEIETPQLFLMGDMFDFISSESNYFIKINQDLINIINELSKDIEIIYLEGNHDFNIKELFPNVKVFSREEQPIKGKFKNKTISFAHGDIFTPKSYDIYCKIIRNHRFLVFLNSIDIFNILSKTVYKSLIKKEICSQMDSFGSFARKRLKSYSSDYIIEGHFHQGKIAIFNNKTYVNIPSLCCSKKYFLFNEKFIEIKL